MIVRGPNPDGTKSCDPEWHSTHPPPALSSSFTNRLHRSTSTSTSPNPSPPFPAPSSSTTSPTATSPPAASPFRFPFPQAPRPRPFPLAPSPLPTLGGSGAKCLEKAAPGHVSQSSSVPPSPQLVHSSACPSAFPSVLRCTRGLDSQESRESRDSPPRLRLPFLPVPCPADAAEEAPVVPVPGAAKEAGVQGGREAASLIASSCRL
ncbi:unnamed protein product [Closterium sp. NIES-53]